MEALLERDRELAALDRLLDEAGDGGGRVVLIEGPAGSARAVCWASCASAPLVEAVRSELYAAGARPRSFALSGVASLTASERRVASLAAEGRTKREIAQALFVTPKTVEVHLSNAYPKLDVRSRRELPGALAG